MAGELPKKSSWSRKWSIEREVDGRDEREADDGRLCPGGCLAEDEEGRESEEGDV